MVQLQIHAQYVKDLSFESPNGPFGAADGQGGVDISVDVRANAKAENHYEVDLILQATGKSAQGTLFVAELTYSGLFTLPDLPMEHRKAVLLIECPRLLFPFGRAIISDVTREGGFPPLMLQPVDFAALYQRSEAQAAAAAAAAPMPPVDPAAPADECGAPVVTPLSGT